MKRFFCCLWLLGILSSWCAGLSGCTPTMLGPTTPSGYRVTLPAASQTLRMQSLPLTVQVSDAAGKLVDDVPVHFRLPADWASRAVITPPSVVTQQGQATATFRARTTGQIMVEITVEDHTALVPIAVVGDTPRF
jgi:hypothetical protein